MDDRRCAACGKSFRLCPRVRDQKYCGEEECRRARRRRWQRARRQADADYRDNQARAQRGWAEGNSAYWRAYRSGTPTMRKRIARSSANGIAGGVRRILQRWTR